MAPKKNYYAVKQGRQTGIFNSWAACREQVQGYPGALFKGFVTKEEAEAYLSPGNSVARRKIPMRLSSIIFTLMVLILISATAGDLPYMRQDSSYIRQAVSAAVKMRPNCTMLPVRLRQPYRLSNGPRQKSCQRWLSAMTTSGYLNGLRAVGRPIHL